VTTKLRRRIDELGIKPEYALAVRCGMSPTTLGFYTTGRCRILEKHLARLAVYLQCSPADLVGDVEE
jgi:Cro/C1-type HTH DNA-binding domain